MNILYKYCDQLGIVKILGSLELKLPYISEVNDPHDCFPFYYCPEDKSAIEKRYLSMLKCRNELPSADYKQKLEKGEIHKKLEEGILEFQKDWNQKCCLLSVSKTAGNIVMWAHYADKHKGVVIGIDFDSVFPKAITKRGILMHPVDYSEQRPKVNILTDLEESQKNLETELTKSTDWGYEEEFRSLFDEATLIYCEQKGLVCLKGFNGKKTWFLRLNPKSIREIIFGLYTEENLKSAIRKLTEQAELQHIKLYQAEESETYTLNLVEIK